MMQLLETLFGGGTRGARRMHQLANTVLIFDEIQTLPVRCVHLFNNAINFLSEQCNTTVVLCTATQPLLNQVKVQQGAIRLAKEAELVSDVRQLFADLKRVEIIDQCRPNGWTYGEVADLAYREAEKVKSCLVIVNTKDAAKQIFLACQNMGIESKSLFHLSTDMCPAHRKAVLAKVKERLDAELPTLCISTQLIEAGVDVDFGCVIRSLAGLDSIAQAAGRCNRNGRLARGLVYLVNLRDENVTPETLEDIFIGQRKTEATLDFYQKNPEVYDHNLLSKPLMDVYYKHYFFDRQDDMIYPVSAKAIGQDDSLLNLLSENDIARKNADRNGKLPANRSFYQSFMEAARQFKAIDAPTQGVVVPYGKAGKDIVGRLHGAFDITLDRELLRETQQFSINVFPRVFEKLLQANALRQIQDGVRIYSLDPRYYDERFGLATEPVTRLETLCDC
jgi:CRISPR-associated endonuclease/helicase Cas3